MNNTAESSMNKDMPTDIDSAVKKLSDKAGLMRELHVFSSKKCKFWMNSLLIITILGTLAISFLSLALPMILSLNDKNQTLLGVAITFVGFVILLVSVSDRIFGFNERYAAHIQGMNLFTEFILDCNRFRHVECKKNGYDENCLVLKALQDRYSEINQLLPVNDLSDRDFLEVKKNFKIKVLISKNLDRDPYLNLDKEPIGQDVIKISKISLLYMILFVVIIIAIYFAYLYGFNSGSSHL